MIAIIDYGAGNLFSVCNALEYLGLPASVTRDPAELRRASGLILPGVGAFPDAMEMLEATGLVPTIREEAEKKPFLGICLGMQMLFDRGFEFRERPGLGLIPGSVRRLEPGPGLKIPHMGWNSLRILQPSPLTEGVEAGSFVYFVHSYMADTPAEYLCAVSDYGEPVTALVRRGTIYGAQFHPEKSGRDGLRMLRNFGRLCGEGGAEE